MKTTHLFYKEYQGWFIDLPEFIDSGLGTESNLAMVLGADTFLDMLSNNGDEVRLTISDLPFEDAEVLNMIGMDQPTERLKAVNHPIQVGAYYEHPITKHVMWLCPVTVYVFGGYYPKSIYYKKVD